MGQILLRNILLEAQLYSYTTKELLDKVLQFQGKTLIFLDTESTGLEPNDSYNQVTEISAMAVDGSTMETLGVYNTKVELGDAYNRLSDPNSPEAKSYKSTADRWLRKYKKEPMHPADVLKMTNYHGGNSESAKKSEPEALEGLEQFIKQYPNPLIIAHNAKFDIKTISARRRLSGLPVMIKRPVLDSVKVAQYFFIPTLIAMGNNPEAKEYLKGLLAKTKYVSYSASLGKLASVFKIKLEGWHQASEDVKMMFQVIQKMIEFLKSHSDLDIRKQQGVQAKRLRKMK